MKFLLILISVLFISACKQDQIPVETQPTAPESIIEQTSEPMVVEAPKPPEPRFLTTNLLRLERSTVESILGLPSLKRIEKDAEVWLYDNHFCNAHIFFYKDDYDAMHVEYVETSEENNLEGVLGQRADFCISTFLQD
jgi:PBP1b-binding outer membrane lipoprotein LpoB